MGDRRVPPQDSQVEAPVIVDDAKRDAIAKVMKRPTGMAHFPVTWKEREQSVGI